MTVPSNQNTKDAIQAGIQAKDWRRAADDLVSCLTEEGECYSSGEIAAFLRVEATSLKFRVTGIGEHIRDAYWAGTLPEFTNGNGGSDAPVQMQYMTVGTGRTPANQPVFVYGPDQPACDSHDFEVDIPAPPGVSVAPSTPALPGPAPTGYPTSYGGGTGSSPPAAQTGGGSGSGSSPPAAQSSPPAAQKPAKKPAKKRTPIQAIKQGSGGLVVTVIKDKRILVPRAVFEAYLFVSGQAMRSGDAVYVTVDAVQAFISLDPDPNATKHSLQSSRGRVLFGNTHDKTAPFVRGTNYTATVSKEGVTITF